jgi:hypothetical protein
MSCNGTECGDPTPAVERTYDHIGAIISYESGDLDNDGVLTLFSYLIRTGLAWSLQGSYGRMAARLIEGGIIARDGAIIGVVEA